MIARYEQSVLSGRSQVTVQRYMGLQNLPHWHMESELIFAQKGSAEVMSENTVYPLTQGRCVFIRSGAVHYIKAEAESIITVMKIDSELLFSSYGEQTTVCPLLENEYDFSDTFEKIRQEISRGQKYYEVICSGLASAVMAEIFRNEKAEALKKSSESTAYKSLLSHISEHYADMTFDEAQQALFLQVFPQNVGYDLFGVPKHRPCKRCRKNAVQRYACGRSRTCCRLRNYTQLQPCVQAAHRLYPTGAAR